MLLFKAVVSAAAVALMCASCSGLGGEVGQPSASETAASPPPTSSGKVFEGTPEERATLVRACLEDQGLGTIDDPMGEAVGFGVDTSGLSPDEVDEAFSTCDAQVGEPKLADLSENELQERYDARVDQHACLVSAGYQVDPVPSFDTFVDEYERSGQQEMWEPAALPNPQPGDNPTVDCPRVGQW